MEQSWFIGLGQTKTQSMCLCQEQVDSVGQSCAGGVFGMYTGRAKNKFWGTEVLKSPPYPVRELRDCLERKGRTQKA